MKPLALVLALACLGSAHATTPLLGKDRGGGDPCENRIAFIAGDIATWISEGGAKNLTFPSPLTQSEYESRMLEAIRSAHVRCVKPGDQGYPVSVGTTPKVCRFDKGLAENVVTCDYDTFMNRYLTTDADQYVLIHHEYAGLAGLENPDGEISQYDLSNQIPGSLDNVPTQRLVPKHKTLQYVCYFTKWRSVHYDEKGKEYSVFLYKLFIDDPLKRDDALGIIQLSEDNYPSLTAAEEAAVQLGEQYEETGLCKFIRGWVDN